MVKTTNILGLNYNDTKAYGLFSWEVQRLVCGNPLAYITNSIGDSCFVKLYIECILIEF